MEIWQTIILAFGGNAALLAVLGLLGKSLLEKLIQRDTKIFESELKSKSDAAIEHLKNELQLNTIEHQIRFSKLHEKRASVIAELYSHLVEVLWAAESLLAPMQWAGEPSQTEKYKSAMNKLVDSYRYFDKHKIYLPNELCDSLETLIVEVRTHVVNFGVYLEFQVETLNDQTRKEKGAALMNGWNAIKNQIPLARHQLEAEFRSLLGATPAGESPLDSLSSGDAVVEDSPA